MKKSRRMGCRRRALFSHGHVCAYCKKEFRAKVGSGGAIVFFVGKDEYCSKCAKKIKTRAKELRKESE